MDTPLKLVFVADDFDSAAEYLAELVSYAGYESSYAQDGAELLRLVRSREPYAVVTDIEMPRIGGIEAAREIRAMSFASGLTPMLIAVSGGALESATRSGLFDHVLAKPVELGKLLNLLDRRSDD